jgi:hypothetical protein
VKAKGSMAKVIIPDVKETIAITKITLHGTTARNLQLAKLIATRLVRNSRFMIIPIIKQFQNTHEISIGKEFKPIVS